MKFRLEIDGMSCEHCVNYVKKVLSQTEGVSDISVEINHALIRVDDKITEAMLKQIIEDAGYDLAGVYPELEN